MPPKITNDAWENATLSNRFLFYKIMTSNPDVCQHLLEILLHIEIDHIEPPNGEQTFDVDAEAKGVRLDVYTKSNGRIFDLEMQTSDTHELPKRARYYQGIMDVDILKVGESYNKLKESYVIFLCLDDIFHHGLPVYTFQNRCDEDTDILLDDKTYKIFFNAKRYDIMSTDEEKDFFRFLTGEKAGSDFTQKLDTLVTESKHNAEWRKQFMTWGQELQLEHERAFKEGLEQGIEQGRFTDARIAAKQGCLAGQDFL